MTGTGTGRRGPLIKGRSVVGRELCGLGIVKPIGRGVERWM